MSSYRFHEFRDIIKMATIELVSIPHEHMIRSKKGHVTFILKQWNTYLQAYLPVVSDKMTYSNLSDSEGPALTKHTERSQVMYFKKIPLDFYGQITMRY